MRFKVLFSASTEVWDDTIEASGYGVDEDGNLDLYGEEDEVVATFSSLCWIRIIEDMRIVDDL